MYLLEINLIQNDSLINILIVYDCAAVVHCATCNNTCINGPFKIICSYFLLLVKTQDWFNLDGTGFHIPLNTLRIRTRTSCSCRPRHI